MRFKLGRETVTSVSETGLLGDGVVELLGWERERERAREEVLERERERAAVCWRLGLWVRSCTASEREACEEASKSPSAKIRPACLSLMVA